MEGCSRRSFLKWSLMLMAALQLPGEVFASLSAPSMSGEHLIHLYNPNTGEFFKDVFWADGNYVFESLVAINILFRDHHNETVKSIDTNLVDLLYRMQTYIGTKNPLGIVCGYRSTETNALLRKKYRRVAKNSYHIVGMAADVRVPGVPLSSLKKLALRLQEGGVGYYPRSRFVHLDTGPVRHW